jgi:hypothetical protein
MLATSSDAVSFEKHSASKNVTELLLLEMVTLPRSVSLPFASVQSLNAMTCAGGSYMGSTTL